MSASALISEPDHFRIEQIDDGLEPLQKLVGGYIEAVMDPAGQWHLYVDEEGKLTGKPANLASTRFLDLLFTEAGRMPFSSYDVLVGTTVWLGPLITVGDSDEHSFPLSMVGRFVSSVMRTTTASRPIVVIEQGDTITVFDRPTDSIPLIKALVHEARLAVANGEAHGVITVYPNITKTRWVELRVEMMDQQRIQINDQREDKSYG